MNWPFDEGVRETGCSRKELVLVGLESISFGADRHGIRSTAGAIVQISCRDSEVVSARRRRVPEEEAECRVEGHPRRFQQMICMCPRWRGCHASEVELPHLASGSAGSVIVGQAPGAITIEYALLPEQPVCPVATTVKLNVPFADGILLKTPVIAFNVNPLGGCPSANR